jgi:2'-5' RNA ligase
VAQSVELLLDDGLDRLVRGQWARLVDAGLPSQARHTGATNAPHITLTVADAFEPRHEAALSTAVAALPIPLRLGSLLLFSGARGHVLVRPVVPSAALLQLHAALDAAVEGAARAPFVRPGAWTPHVTLARGLDAGQVAPALACLGRVVDAEGRAVGARRWDTVTKQVWPLR